MRPFKIALGLLTFLRFGKVPVKDEELSRAAAYFPMVGILIGSLLVFLDQGVKEGFFTKRHFPNVLEENFILFIVLTAFRISRGLDEIFWVSARLFQRVVGVLIKCILFCWVPSPLRWITLCLMTTFSSGALVLALRKMDAKKWELEDMLWSSLICVFLAIACGPLGIFVLGVSLLFLAAMFRLGPDRFLGLEEGLEGMVIVAVIGFYYWVK
ncbi:MAG: hypothetical protein HYS07_11345 [Chlamydiae bacterium]|nr:hypothetical protein [Chlamydiota bacterium]MBI3278081.1 hypothetical protein [Chlamydiota bacterium]